MLVQMNPMREGRQGIEEREARANPGHIELKENTAKKRVNIKRIMPKSDSRKKQITPQNTTGSHQRNRSPERQKESKQRHGSAKTTSIVRGRGHAHYC